VDRRHGREPDALQQTALPPPPVGALECRVHRKSALPARHIGIERISSESRDTRSDDVVVEEPLEIRLLTDGLAHSVTVTMRTPGHDRELAVGFLLAERIIDDSGMIASLRSCGPSDNVMQVQLHPGAAPQLAHLQRNFMATSSCGLCGKATLDAVLNAMSSARVDGLSQPVLASTLRELPRKLASAQAVFRSTGGLHAVAAFSREGELVALYEDVGRHNAFDKLVGACELRKDADFRDRIVVLSGRASFELLQKAAAANVSVVAAIGAPSSLAVELAERAGIVLIGFLRAGGFNIYSRPSAVAMLAEALPS